MSCASEAHGLVKTFGDRHAVDGVDFQIADRECFGFLGPNGAGKTTTMRMLFGRLRRTAGDLRVLGLDPDRQTRQVRSRIGVVTQENNLDQDLTVLENLVIHAGYFGLGGAGLRRRAVELLEFMQLDGRERSQVRELSGGMQRRLLIARGLINEPELMILDEPTTGLDPQARLVVWQRLSELRERGVTIVLTTHYMMAGLGLFHSWWALLLPLVLASVGPLFSAPAMAWAILSKRSFHHLFYYTELVVSPMFFFSGAFFPVDRLPGYLQVVIWITPLYHVVNLARALTYGTLAWGLLVDAVFIAALTLVLAPITMRLLNRHLTT